MALLCCLLLTIGLAVYIFYPQRVITRQRQKTRSEYLAERRAAIAENLRDLVFEHRAGKYRDEDFERERNALAKEQDALDEDAERAGSRPRPVH